MAEFGDFLRGEIDGATFGHADHVHMAFEVLRRHRNFAEAAAAYSVALRRIAARAASPGAYHETITLAFLSLIAERMVDAPRDSFDEFVRDNPDLLDKDLLARWYAPERLMSPVARATFVLPDATR